MTISEVKALAMWMTWKCAVVGCLWRGKGWVCVNPKLLSQAELQNLTRRYTTEIQPFIGPNQDIPAPDVNTNPQIMAWLMDTYSMNVGHTEPGVTTGKPIVLGGSEGRSEATGRGCVYAIENAARVLDLDLEKSRTAVQASAMPDQLRRDSWPSSDRRWSQSAIHVAESTTRMVSIWRRLPRTSHAPGQWSGWPDRERHERGTAAAAG